jgi:glycosyltransferase involved in cell wall biosynthesis
MLLGKKVIVILPAYNAQATVARTLKDIPREIADDILLVADASSDQTVETARQLGLKVYIHPRNLGYGANQKACYTDALRHAADVIVMLHPDYQYDPRLVPAMASMIASGVYDVVLGSRILGSTTLSNGMP